jgi:DNA-binding LacI/PurR family transcriptional regulator
MKSKTQQVYAGIREMIESGRFPKGSRLPAETTLAEEYGVSRPTIAKALADLVDAGYVVRRAGAGSFVTNDWQTVSSLQRKTFGLLSPKLGEVFEPISGEIASLSHEENFNLLWSTPGQADAGSSGGFYTTAATRFVESEVDGVFMVPLEYFETSDTANHRVVEHLEKADIPIVLIDSDVYAFPERSNYDLVGIDNVRTAYTATAHYLAQGAERVDFVLKPYSHSTVAERVYGYQLALLQAGISPDPEWIHRGDESDPSFVRRCLRNGAENVICQNDATAVELMHAMSTLGVSIPGEVRVIGFDDVHYSRLARVPLTTCRQPCRDIGRVAVEMMMRRLERPASPPLTVQLPATLIARESSVLPGGRSEVTAESGVEQSRS